MIDDAHEISERIAQMLAYSGNRPGEVIAEVRVPLRLLKWLHRDAASAILVGQIDQPFLRHDEMKIETTYGCVKFTHASEFDDE